VIGRDEQMLVLDEEAQRIRHRLVPFVVPDLRGITGAGIDEESARRHSTAGPAPLRCGEKTVVFAGYVRTARDTQHRMAIPAGLSIWRGLVRLGRENRTSCPPRQREGADEAGRAVDSVDHLRRLRRRSNVERRITMSQKTNKAADQAAARGVHAVTPHLVCAGAAGAIEFYEKAFGATEMIRLAGPDGKIMHACVCINGSSVMLVDEFPAMGNSSPKTLKGTPVTIHLIVEDVDGFVNRAVEAGAKVVMPVEDQFWGDRYGVIEDPFGHRWSVATPQRQMTEEEISEAARTAMAR
jgi:PhnB protein